MNKLKKHLLLIVSAFILSLPLLLLLATVIFGATKTFPNTYVLDKNYSHLDRSQIIEQLGVDFPLPESALFKYQDREFEIEMASISAVLDKQSVSDNLLYRNLNYGFKPLIKSLFTSYSFPLAFSFDNTLLDEKISSISAQIEKPFIPTELQVDPKTKVIVAKVGQLGLEIDKEELLDSFQNHLINWQHQNSIEIPVKTVGFLPSEEQVESTKAKALKLIGKSLLLEAPTPELADVPIDDLTLISWLNFDDTPNREKITAYVDSISQSLKKDPVNAVFKFDSGQVTEFRPASEGHQVKQSELVDLITDNLNNILAPSQNSLALKIPTQVTQPEITTEAANDLGIRELLGRGVSTFKHSSATRNFNIEKGASIVNRILVPPGETFSFLEHLGEVTLEAGYKKAYIIRQGRTELDVGGGICQVSTTLFRAMLDSGVNITERRPHAFRVSYYEEDSPPGYDATIFIPSPDLKFVNDTGHHLLVQNTYDGQNRKLIYEIYGTSDGRKAEISNYRKWDYAPPPPTRYIDDPTLAPGQLVKEETAVPGLKVAFDWKVVRSDETIHQKTFQSNYVPWAAVYRRGIQP
ncbi:MAG: VanW family protein [Patescibacteria group bacterium]|jgi:vancomycin resistance protein YoaR